MKFLAKNYVEIIFFSLIGLYLFPVWYFEYFPAVDAPSHAANGVNLRRLLTGECKIVSDLYTITPAIVPNYFSEIIFATISNFLSTETISKSIASAYIVLFPLSILRLIKTTHPKNTFMVFLVLIMLYNFQLFWGNYNFLFGVIIYFYALPWFIKNKNNLNFKNWVKLFSLFNLIYITHIFALFLFCLTIMVALLIDLYLDFSKKNFYKFLQSGFYYISTALPSLILLFLYLLLDKIPIDGIHPFSTKLLYLAFPMDLARFSSIDQSLMYVVALFIWTVFVTHFYSTLSARSKLMPSDSWLLLATALSIFILFGPSFFGGGWVIELRLELLLFTFLTIWCSTNKFKSGEKNIIIFLSSVICLFIIIPKISHLDKFSNYIKHYQEAWYYIPDNSTVMIADINPLTFYSNGANKNLDVQMPYLAGYLISERCVAEVSNFHSAEKNTFPVSYKDKTHPYYHLGSFTSLNRVPIIPPIVDFKKYTADTGVNIDYLALFGRKELLYKYRKEDKLDEQQLYSDFMSQVNLNFDLIFESTDHMVRVYKHKPI